MKILLLGKNGQVGRELQRSLAPLGTVVALGSKDERWPSDFTQPQSLRQTVEALRPQVIVNAAAYTAVDRAESEPEQARSVNATAPGVLAEAAESCGAWLVHYSTDYVFDGSGTRAWTESDAPAPLNVYGQTKLEGEQQVQARCSRHLILRTSWVYGRHGGNFIRSVLRLAAEREELRFVSDQVGAPTGADLIADVTAHLLRSVTRSEIGTSEEPAGIYHLVAAGETNWYAYAAYILETVRAHPRAPALRARRLDPIPSQAYPTAARRPLNSRLDTRKIQKRFELALPDWREGVRRVLEDWLQPPVISHS